MIDQYTIQRLRDLPIEGVAERLGLRVVHHKSLCPFHDDTHASLTFYQAKNTYRCFVCDAHGGPIDLAMHKLRLTFPEACRWLAGESHIIIDEEEKRPKQKPKKERPFDAARYSRFFEHPTINAAAARFLYDERHIDPRVVRWCRLNSYVDKQGTPWLQIPYYDMDGRLLGVQSRNLTPSCQDSGMPRFRFPQGTECHVYNLPVVRMLVKGEPLFITEGCSDCWAMLSAGHKAIAIPSATLLKEEDLKPLMSCAKTLGTTFHMYPDQDAPGARLYLQLKEILETPTENNPCPSVLIHHQLPEGYKDFSDYYTSTFKKEKQ